ncbi:MAG: phytoene dehydrogenase [Epsilonproteobacteria bacterium]|nr:MAG: phytoene dehydrogenase [Campylobacterota bacterium]RLA65776.1 MAG: phytoene dehydrogenase [Campylobacterota bacterium]
MLFKSQDKISKSYDVIIIGSGLAGMTAANKLAKNGRAVLLLESHNKLGGFATWFKRKGGTQIFDISLHGFPFGMKKTCRKYWSKEISDAIIKIKGVRFKNPMYDLETDFTREDYTSKLINHFKIPEEKVHAFFKYLEEMNFYDPPKLTNGELFEKFFPGRKDVLRFLLEPIVYANGSNLEDPAITYGIVFSNFMSKGVYTFQGGTDQLIDKMKSELLKNGVDIKMHSRVDKILIENGKATGVLLKGDEIRSKAVLSNSNLLSTIFKMTGKEHFGSEYIKRAQKVRLNTSSCQVYMGMKEGETIPRMSDLIFYSEDEYFSTDLILSPKVGSQTFSIYYPDCRPHLKNHYAIVSSSNSRYEDWENLSEEDYKVKKQFLIDRALDSLEKVIPGVREKIDFVEAATPLTVEKYTLHQKGASFGTKFEGLDISMNMHKQVDGLFHTGSVGIIMSGWLGAANYGVIQAHGIEGYL